MSNEYAWDYLKQTQKRADNFWPAIAEFLREAEVVLDINCGFIPLHSKLLPFVKHYAGNDISLEAIEFCSKVISVKDREKHTFVWASDVMIADNARKVFPGLNFDTFLFLGVTSGNRLWESMTEHESFNKLIDTYMPRRVLLETASTVPDRHLSVMFAHLRNLGYAISAASEYSAGYEKNGDRTFWVYERATANDNN